ncbi:MAG: TrkH family potassium uptake protein, partial [Pseudomonadota bacterium]
SMSGLTTTGSTVVSGLDEAPPGFLLWRSILQWLGGVGVVIMATALMPFLAVGGMQLFRMEASEPTDKILPGAGQFASAITMLYVGLTAICFAAYWLCGMTGFDAINHAMTTIATGGFSTKDASFGHFLTDPNIRFPVDIVASVFMIIGALPFTLFLLMLSGRISGLTRDSEVRLFMVVVAVSIAIIALRIGSAFELGAFQAFRLSTFNVISLMTGTGYASADYMLWGAFATGFFFIIPFVGGCSGSTSCGLKVFRLQVAFAALALHVRRLAHPHRVTVARYNGRTIGDDVFLSVLSFFFIYFAIFATAAVILSNLGLDTITALSSAATSIANVGPGLGPVVGPSGNFSSLPDAAKWVMSITMLIGRLELLTVLVLFTPGFWRR